MKLKLWIYSLSKFRIIDLLKDQATKDMFISNKFQIIIDNKLSVKFHNSKFITMLHHLTLFKPNQM